MNTCTDKTTSTPVAHAQQQKETPFFQKPGSDGFFAKADPSKNRDDDFFVQKKEKGADEKIAYLENNSPGTIYYKPEHGDGAFSLAAGAKHYSMVDGVATSKNCDQVFQINNNSGKWDVTAQVDEKGEVDADQYGFGYFLGSWKGVAWLKEIQEGKDKDHGWDRLFLAAASFCRAEGVGKETPTPDAKSKIPEVKSKEPEVKDKKPEVKSKTPETKTITPGVKTIPITKDFMG